MKNIVNQGSAGFRASACAKWAAWLCLGAFGSLSWAGCDDPQKSDEVAYCLGLELREADSQINLNYMSLMEKLDAPGKTALRAQQRAWIKERDATCQLNTKESNREKWYQALLADYAKTVCVTRLTHRRALELENKLAQKDDKRSDELKPVTPPPVVPGADMAYDRQPPTKHSNGKWYFEITVDHAAVVNIEPCVINMGVWSPTMQSGVLNNVRKRDAAKGVKRYGIAVDLDNGKFYHSENGEWTNRPGSNQGMDIQARQVHTAAIQTSAESIAPYVNARAIVANFGEKPMAYPMPEGYSPWLNVSR